MSSIEKCNLWYYQGNRVTNWHYDGHDNFLYVVEGVKKVYLSKPGTIECLSVFSMNNNQGRRMESRGYFKVTVRKN